MMYARVRRRLGRCGEQGMRRRVGLHGIFVSHKRALIAAASILIGSSWQAVRAESVKSVFVIAMENHNWTQPVSDTSAPHQIFNNADAPFINSIVNPYFNGGALNPQATLYGSVAPISINTDVSYATAYHNVLATPSGNNPHIHPSEPSYIWSEAGTNFGVANDNTPYGSNGNNQTTN